MFDAGQRWVGRYIILWVQAGAGERLRIGVAAGKKLGCAPERNRIKRRLREAVRLSRQAWKGSVAVVVMARAGALKAPWDEVRAELQTLAHKAGLQNRVASEEAS